MGYEDALYHVDNIIGYTGDLNNAPTVYFRTADKCGRITQNHPNKKNIGRNKIRPSAIYTISNENVGGVQKCVERLRGVVHHVSRNYLVSVSNISPGDLDILKQAIWLFPNEKEKTAKKSKA